MCGSCRRRTVDVMTEITTRDTRLANVHTLQGRRAGDIERTATCEALAEHYGAGRLSRDELEDRLAWAVRAVTEDELRRLTADLPLATPEPEPGPGPQPVRGTLGSPTWPASVVVAVIALVISAFVAGGMLLVLGAVNPLLFIGACLGGGAAVVVGASGSYLLARATRRP